MSNTANAFIGLAPFLRLSIAGDNLQAVAQDLLREAESHPEDHALWMNLATAMFCLDQRELGLTIQAEALAQGHLYPLAAAVQPARLRLLVLMAPGDLTANMPIDCLLENSDVDLIFHYIAPGDDLRASPPEHDVLLVALSETEANRDLLAELEPSLETWPRPVVNRPQCIPHIARDTACALLHDVPGLRMPPTLRVSRDLLQSIATGAVPLRETLGACAYPLLVRPLDSHAGRDLARIDGADELAAYLARVADADFFVSVFIDYSGADGLFRKFRVALVDGRPFACHMAVSAHWMVHYVNAGMYEDAAKRAQEQAFMTDFDAFAQRHRAALDALHRRIGLDYLCIDCAETRDGELLIFEIDHAMVVHAMDDAALFPYKQIHMQKLKTAFRDFLLERARRTDASPTPATTPTTP